MRVSRSGAAMVLVAAATGAAACGLGMFVLVQSEAPASLATPAPIERVPVSPQNYTDPRPVDVVVTVGSPLAVLSPREGMVTRVSCRVNERWRSGSSAVTIDGRPLLSLHTRQPLWRDLRPGNVGTDVAALKSELARLGKRVSSGDRLAPADVEAFRDAADDIHLAVTGDVIASRDIVWLPRRSVVASDCPARVGQLVGPGDQLLASPAPLDVRVHEPEGLLPGKRVLRIDDLVIPLGGDLQPALPSAVTGVTETMSYRSEAGGESTEGARVRFTARVELTTPAEVVALPPSTITTAGMHSGCVASDGDVLSVRIVSSELGRTLVLFDGTPPEFVSTRGPQSCA